MESLLRGATRLFAALGYDAISMSQIAESTGVDPASVGFHGTKRDLYLAVIERANRMEHEALDAAIGDLSVADAVGAAQAVHNVIDRYLDFCVANPDFPALWIHRWLWDAADLTGLEREYSQPLIATTTHMLRRAVAEGAIPVGADLEYCVWTIIWCVHGFVQGGVLNPEGERVGPEDEAELDRFRVHVHQLAHRELALRGDLPQT